MIIHGVTEDAGHEGFVETDFQGKVGKGNGAIKRVASAMW